MLSERWCAAATQAETQRREIAQRHEELEGLYEISKVFDNLENTSAAFRQITRRIARLLNAEIWLLARYDETRARLVGMPPGYGLSDDQIRECVIAVDAQTDAIWNVEEREYFLRTI